MQDPERNPAADVSAGNPSAVQRRIDIVSDAICPWCYIGKHHLERALDVLAREGLRFTTHWHPFQLNPDMPKQGRDRAEYRLLKFGSAARSAELDQQVTQAAERRGLRFRLDLITRTPNTIDAHRLILFAEAHGRQDAVVEALFQAYFTQGHDIGDRAVLAGCAAEAGLDAAAAAAFLAGDQHEDEIRATEASARAAGVSAVPSFFLDGHKLFSGAVPADAMAAAFRRAHAILSEQDE